MVLICAVIALVPVLNSVFSAFNAAYYARWFYMPLLIMSAMTARALELNRKNALFSLYPWGCSVVCTGKETVLKPGQDGQSAGRKTSLEEI